jgi:hypothetical protein
MIPRTDIFDANQSPHAGNFRRRLTKDALIVLDGAILLGEELVLVNRGSNAAERRRGG